MSSPIVVRALEAEMRRVERVIRDELRAIGNLTEGSVGIERKRIEQARAILTKIANEYDAVDAELQAARSAMKLSGDLSTRDNVVIKGVPLPGYGNVALNVRTDNGESAPAGRCAP